ncbi:DUF3987 domain-containing protein [Thauera sp. AutoDN2]|uniref:DUF3987 domain-containing protein n=1 Tax=Thauera sp. AutoDN2 TaxID=3416051 RepID=UPI003F4B73AA
MQHPLVEASTDQPIHLARASQTLDPDDTNVLDILHDHLKGYCADVSERLSAPPEFLIASTLCVVGAAICSRCGIRPKLFDSWLVTPNLWALLVGEPSSMKSPAMSQPLNLLRRVEARIQKASSVTPPPRLIANDATAEKLGEILRDNPGGLLYVRDELAAVFETWQNPSRRSERQFFLEAWNGTSPYTSDRIMRGTTAIQNLSLAVMGTIQPAQLARQLGMTALEDGLAQRFQLLVFPLPRKREFSDKREDTDAKAFVEGLLYRLATADYRQLCKSDGTAIPSITFADDAYQLYKTWWIENAESAATDQVLASFLTKYERLVPALALVDHLISVFSPGVPTVLSPVSHQSLARAIRQAAFFKRQVTRSMTYLGDSRIEEAGLALIQRLSSGQLQGTFSVRDILRASWSRLTDRQTVEHVLDRFVQNGTLKRENSHSGPAGGRPTIYYSLAH